MLIIPAFFRDLVLPSDLLKFPRALCVEVVQFLCTALICYRCLACIYGSWQCYSLLEFQFYVKPDSTLIQKIPISLPNAALAVTILVFM